MTLTALLLKQTKDAHIWTNKLIDSVPIENWDDTPNTLASNISWQIGHLIISEYYHSILVVSGFDEEITQKIDLKTHNQRYGYESVPAKQVGHNDGAVLREQLHFMQHKVIQNVSALTLKDLESKVEQPIKQKHPVAITKLDAVSWNIKHTMWHCGQIATIKRLIHGGFDFGLPRRQ
ncbi:DinB family protein [Aggregatimonas sangjinii]|uniref:DinB family protein n=1 Tax=Aggregatimonas sangjinii TaxID=2583587 RepID=A0A5B7SUJ7_9FLAO|nr:DinB family protein [Aggregatimonas sangjinii]QCX00718.1 DinB family protein [Aggregatimonas sangjinii]